MSISYVIATYSGTSRRHPTVSQQNALDIHITELYNLLQQKRNREMPIYIRDVVIMCPKFRGEYNKQYYQYEKWFQMFNKIPTTNIHMIQYRGENKHHSYDQWLQGALMFDNDYMMIVEDDYMISADAGLQFDFDIVEMYKKTFPLNVGYLCQTLEGDRNVFGLHATLTNGLVSRDTLKALSPVMQTFYETDFWVPQVQFYYMFVRKGVPVKDMTDKYNAYFWNSKLCIVETIYEKDSNRKYFIPVQMFKQ